MNQNEKNFRSHYYEKVGFRGVEEKKSLDILLNETPKVDLEKIQNFCIRYTLPGIYRTDIWKMLLNITTVYKNSQEMVWNHRALQYSELKRALEVTRHLGEDRAENITQVWLLNNGNLPLRPGPCISIVFKNFAILVNAVSKVLDTEAEVFWVAQNLFNTLQPQCRNWHLSVELMQKILKDDTDLLDHLSDYRVLEDEGIFWVVATSFCSVFQPHILSRLLDKVIAGSFKILLYTLCAFLHLNRDQIIESESPSQVVDLLARLNEVDQDKVLSHGIDVWEMDGSPLQHGSQTDGPRKREDSQVNPEGSYLSNRLSREIHVSM